jgi:hypothetical protein
MISRVNIYFEDEKLRRNLESYSKEHRKSFSETVLEFAGAGFSLFQKTGSVNTDVLMEKLKTFEEAKKEAKKEIEFLRDIIKKLLRAEEASTHKTNPLTESEMKIPEISQLETKGRLIQLEDEE